MSTKRTTSRHGTPGRRGFTVLAQRGLSGGGRSDYTPIPQMLYLRPPGCHHTWRLVRELPPRQDQPFKPSRRDRQNTLRYRVWCSDGGHHFFGVYAMTEKELLLDRFHRHNNRLTLGQLLEPPLGAAYRQRISELRQDGYEITLERNTEHPTQNTYTLNEQVPTHVTQSGQKEWLFPNAQY